MTEWLWHVDEAEEREKDVSALRLPMGEVIKQTLYCEQDNWFLWLPVALGAGCAAYFTLLVEPGWVMVLSFLLLSIAFVILVRKHTLAFIFSIITLCIAR